MSISTQTFGRVKRSAMNAWVGVDPGATGAIVMVKEDGGVIVRDFPGDECALVGLLSALGTEAEVKAVWVEQQQAMPGQGVSSTFKLGMNFGMWIAAMAFMRWPYRTVRPAEWKKGLGYPAKDKKAGKAYSLTLARRLYPQAAGLLSRAGDHNRAEALILAHLAKTGA